MVACVCALLSQCHPHWKCAAGNTTINESLNITDFRTLADLFTRSRHLLHFAKKLRHLKIELIYILFNMTMSNVSH